MASPLASHSCTEVNSIEQNHTPEIMQGLNYAALPALPFQSETAKHISTVSGIKEASSLLSITYLMNNALSKELPKKYIKGTSAFAFITA